MRRTGRHAMPVPTRTAMPATAPELIGFLRVSRRRLAFGAAASCFLFVGVHDLHATVAYAAPEEVVIVEGQDLSVAATVQAPEVERDGVDVVNFTPMMWPLDPGTKISSYFGLRFCAGCSRDHQGVDYNPGDGHPIRAIADGTVVEVGNPSGALGVYAIVEHQVDGQPVRSVYGHMQMGSMDLQVGDTVNMGQVLGAVGDTGMSTGPHLHFGILIGGEAVEPLAWMKAHVTESW